MVGLGDSLFIAIYSSVTRATCRADAALCVRVHCIQKRPDCPPERFEIVDIKEEHPPPVQAISSQMWRSFLSFASLLRLCLPLSELNIAAPSEYHIVLVDTGRRNTP
jgi:hypothetical protein